MSGPQYQDNLMPWRTRWKPFSVDLCNFLYPLHVLYAYGHRFNVFCFQWSGILRDARAVLVDYFLIHLFYFEMLIFLTCHPVGSTLRRIGLREYAVTRTMYLLSHSDSISLTAHIFRSFLNPGADSVRSMNEVDHCAGRLDSILS